MRYRGQVMDWRRGVTLAFLGACGLAGPAAAPAALLDPPAAYRVRGVAAMQVRGPQCCGDTQFTGRFEGGYSLTSSGGVIMSSLRVEWDDRDVLITDGVIDLFSTRATLRCPSANLTTPARGALLGPAGGPAQLQFTPGALKFEAAAAEGREKDGTCASATLTLDTENGTPVLLTHDPQNDRFLFTGSFAASIEGDSYALNVSLVGNYDNRPPQARIALLSEALPQGGCPARAYFDGQVWEWVADANDPRGWVGTPHSLSVDPDGPNGRADIRSDLWYYTPGTGTRVLIGDDALLSARVFEWGTRHTLELLTVDFAGASSASACQFRVVDETPPVVVPPKPVVLSCAASGGTTPASSPALQAFLAGASASDIADATLVQLSSQTGGTDITGTTVFPSDNLAHDVVFRFSDDARNIGSARSTVTVTDSLPPSASLRLTPTWVPATGRFFSVRARLTARDDCGARVVFRLASIVSSAPRLDAADIQGARVGADDRHFYLRARQGTWFAPRVYVVTYEALDMAGNRTTLEGQVVVGRRFQIFGGGAR
jgi:hypothetical protein